MELSKAILSFVKLRKSRIGVFSKALMKWGVGDLTSVQYTAHVKTAPATREWPTDKRLSGQEL